MFLGYNTNGFAHHRLADAIDILREQGYAAVALTPDVHHHIGDADLRGLRCVIETGARFLLDPRRKHQPTLLDPDPAARAVRSHFLGACIRDAAALGADAVSFWSGAADATMSHGEGWRFLTTGVYIERAQLIARLLEVCFSETDHPAVSDHIALMNLLRMACALEPYLRVYTADIRPKFILDFLLFNEDFPRSIRFSTQRIEESLADISEHRGLRSEPLRIAGRLNARLKYADLDEIEEKGAASLLANVAAECAQIHEAVYDTFVTYPLEFGLPA